MPFSCLETKFQKVKPSLHRATSHTSHPIKTLPASMLVASSKTCTYHGSPGSQLNVSASHLPEIANGDAALIAQSDIARNILKGSILEQIRLLLVHMKAHDNALAKRKYILYTC